MTARDHHHCQNLSTVATILVCGILIFSLPSTDSSSQLVTSSQQILDLFKNDPNSLVINEEPSMMAGQGRKKRQSGGGSTAVIGARITREATAGDWQTANFAVNDEAPASRGKRDVHNQQNRNSYGPPALAPVVQHQSNSYGAPAPIQSSGGYSSGGGQSQNFGSQSHQSNGPTTKIDINLVLRLLLRLLERMQQFLTRTQELFSYINFDIVAARRYGSRNEIQANSNLRINLVYDPNGVKCHQVCDGDTVGYGLIGLCTPTYCQCDRTPGSRNHQESFCMHNTVFDPVTLTCLHPANTILCSDIQRPSTSYGVGAAPAPVASSAYGVPQH